MEFFTIIMLKRGYQKNVLRIIFLKCFCLEIFILLLFKWISFEGAAGTLSGGMEVVYSIKDGFTAIIFMIA